MQQNITNAGTLTVIPAATTNYPVIAIDQNGCVGKADTAHAIILAIAPNTVQVTGTSPICPGQSSLLSLQTTGTTGSLTYSWSNPSFGNSPGPFSVTPTQTTTYTVNVTNSCGVTVTQSFQVVINPPPTMQIISDNVSGCIPTEIHFNDNSLTGNTSDPINSWQWNFGDGTFSSAQNPSHTYAQAGTYPVSLTVTTVNGCTNNTFTAPLLITTNPLPVAAFSVNNTTLNVPGDVLICTNQSTGAATYFWTFGDGGSSTQTNPEYNYSNINTYQIQLTATNIFGCSDAATKDVETNANIVFPNAFTPNPGNASGGYYDKNNLDNDIFFPYASGVIEYKMQIFDRWGELIFETFDWKQGWDGYYRGKLCQADVYIWKALFKFDNEKIYAKSGDVTLLR